MKVPNIGQAAHVLGQAMAPGSSTPAPLSSAQWSPFSLPQAEANALSAEEYFRNAGFYGIGAGVVVGTVLAVVVIKALKK